MQTSAIRTSATIGRPALSTRPAEVRSVMQKVPYRRHMLCKASPEGVEGVISGEWEASWSLATYDDVMTYFNHSMLKSHHTPSTRLSDIMQRKLITASPDDTLADLHARGVFQKVSGLPVTREDGTLVGVISRKDMEKPGQTVRDVMTHPPVAARPTDPVSVAACLMLKYKVHRIPIVDAKKRCVGIVARTDVFTALAVDAGAEADALNIDM